MESARGVIAAVEAAGRGAAPAKQSRPSIEQFHNEFMDDLDTADLDDGLELEGEDPATQ